MFKSKLIALMAMLTVTGLALAGAVKPISYTATLGETGFYHFYDETGKQLIDDMLGSNNWQENLGKGNAYEWMGWLTSNPSLRFTFNGAVKIDQILIGFYRGDSIALPKKVIINNKSFALTGTEIAAGKRGFLKFNGPFTGTLINIDLIDDNASSWIFVDEIQFNVPSIEGTASWKTTHTVTCQNLTQNKTVIIAKTSNSIWNCEQSGLAVTSGDKVKVTIEGTRY